MSKKKTPEERLLKAIFSEPENPKEKSKQPRSWRKYKKRIRMKYDK